MRSACVSVCNYCTYVCARSQTHMHNNGKVRQVAKETAMIAKDRGIEVKTLKEQLRRQEYLTKKQSRAAEAAVRKTQDSVNRVIQLEGEIAVQKRQTRKDTLAEYAEDVRRLKKTQRKVQKSLETWSTRLVCACMYVCT